MLRRIDATIAEPKIIRTFQGVGYMLSADETQQEEPAVNSETADDEVPDEVDVKA